jgi:hypothetical protein
MAATIIERPYKYCFSKNEIRYVFSLDNLTRINLVLEVKIKYKRTAATTDPIIDLATLQLVPNTDGLIYFPINKYLDSLLKYVVPLVDHLVTPATQQTCFFWVEFRELSNVDIDTSFDDSESSTKRLAIKGGVSKEKFSRNNFFENVYNIEPFFFTWQPSGRFVFTNQPLFISSFFPNGSLLDSDSYKLVFDTMTIAGTTSRITKPLDTYAGKNLYHFNIGIHFNSLPNNLHWFDVSIINGANDVVIAAYRYYVQYRPIYNIYDLIWHNSLGGIDFARVRGDISWELEKNVDEGDAGFGLNEAMAIVKSAEMAQVAVNYSNKFKGDIGFLNTKKEQEALIELLITRSIYWQNDSRWIPCLNVQKSIALRKSSDELFNFPIEWNIAINNEVFTPVDFELGIGDTTTD